MIICPYPFCNARVWLGRLVDPSSGDRCEGKEGAYGGRLAPLQPGMCAGSGLPMRGANVVRKRSVTNPGDPAGAAGAVSGGPADGEGSVPLAGGSAAGDGSDAVGGRDAASMGPQPVTGPAASGGQTPVVVAQPQAGPPPAAGMVGTTHPHPGRPGSVRSRFALRNWRVRWRLAALIAVPLLTAAVLGALTIHGDVSNWQATGRVQHLAQLNSAVVKYIQALEDERDYSVASTANRSAFSARLRTAQRVTDGAAAQVTALADGITVGGGYQLVAVQAVNAVQVGVETLPLVRKAVADPLFPNTAIMQVYTVNIIQPANTFTSVVGNEASRYRSPARRHLPRRTAPGPGRHVGSAGHHGEGGQFPAADAIVRRRCQPPAGTAAGKGGSGQLQRIRRSRRAAELQQHGDRAAGRYRRRAGINSRRSCFPSPPRRTRSPRRMRAPWPRQT